ncbi:hypothetical protein RND81_03G191700 [Saponaria officinalis]
MAAMSFGAPQPWPPPPTTKTFKDNCNPGVCTTTCLQYCNYLYFQPPPQQQQQQQFPLITNDSSDDDDSSSSRSISPLMAALIAVLAAAFLLLFYYTVVSRICRRRRQTRRSVRRRLDPSTSHRVDPMIHDPARPDTGLDESYIRQITVFKYKRGDGLVEATECAVCLAEFSDEESLRLMPNCEHAFHIDCIDTWLVTHSSCPLCRSTMNPLPARSAAAAAATGGVSGNVSVAALRVERSNDEVVVVENGGDVRIEVVVEVSDEEHLEEREKEIG